MPLWPTFIGGSYQTRSPSFAADQCVNLYLETNLQPGDVKQGFLYGTPGLLAQINVSTANSRGAFQQDGRAWFVVGTGLYELDVLNSTGTLRGSVADDGLPVFFASNGRGGEQLACLSAGFLYILSLTANTLSAAVSLPLTNPATSLGFIDGYFLLTEADTVRVWFSNLENGSTWDPLDFFAKSETSDNNVCLVVCRERVYVFGTQTSLAYYNSGDADDPFLPYSGTLMQEGCVSPWAAGILGESVIWCAQDNQGRHRFVAAANYVPQEISTPAISAQLASYGDLSDAELLCYEDEGHTFACWTLPTASGHGITWCFDAKENAWHQRQSWDSQLGQYGKWRVRGLCSTSVGLMVGEWDGGTLSLLDLDTYTERGGVLRRLRRAPYLSAENQWLFLDQVEMGLQVGVGNSASTDPRLMLSVSRDGAQTWSNAVPNAPMGTQGGYLARAIWRRLGRARADRLVLEVTQTDPVKACWGPGVWLRATAGSGQL